MRLNFNSTVNRAVQKVTRDFLRENRNLSRQTTEIQDIIYEAGRESKNLENLEELRGTVLNVQQEVSSVQLTISKILTSSVNTVNGVENFLTVVSGIIDVVRSINKVVMPLSSTPPLTPAFGTLVAKSQATEASLTLTDTTIEVSKDTLRDLKAIILALTVVVDSTLGILLGILNIALTFITQLIDSLQGVVIDEDAVYQVMLKDYLTCIDNFCKNIANNIIPELKKNQDIIDSRVSSKISASDELIESLQRLLPVDYFPLIEVPENSDDSFADRVSQAITQYNLTC